MKFPDLESQKYQSYTLNNNYVLAVIFNNIYLKKKTNISLNLEPPITML